MNNFVKSFQFAFRGLRFAWSGRNFRVQCGSALAVMALALWLGISGTELLILMLVVGGILSLEVMNTAIEEMVNFVSPEFHPLAGRIKDLSAGAVLILSIASIVIGVVLFYPYLLARFAAID